MNQHVGPTAPNITTKDLLAQFWADAYGKETQTAATYSYTWLADQFGHVCIGILADHLAMLVSAAVIVWLGWSQSFNFQTGLWPGLVLAVIGASIWEVSTYFDSVKKATGPFPLDSNSLRNNAITATIYLSLGALLGLAFHLSVPWMLALVAILVVVAISLAPPWLRQKIIWQKASIPYLSRLANAVVEIGPKDVKALRGLLNSAAPGPDQPPCQVVIGGPIGCGRTSLAAAIGTEFSFRKRKVRYLSFDSLLEFAAIATIHNPFPDDAGPTTISYWPWSEAQVVIIDDIGPMLAADHPERQANLARFTGLLDNRMKQIGVVLSRCHTVWVIGDLRPPFENGTPGVTLDHFAAAIAKYCGTQHRPMVIELSPTPTQPAAKGQLLPTTRRAPQAVKVRDIRGLASQRVQQQEAIGALQTADAEKW